MSKYKVAVSGDLRRAVPDYLAERRRDLPLLRSFYVTEDRESLLRTAHAFTCSGRSFGIPRISELGEQIEALSKKGDAEGVSARIAELKDYIENLEVLYR